ncbi:hypothetical protein BGW36DRAFT_306167 [Talaromyces proteolyticus]|uniref:Asl1-like glycosyl hydrolase catalytic domain-containing protein n=1 Tax=Talaromyces proteolyticus TaxID=1131652 RepID=A0AAD4KGQ0_9EURO|nr:uncharacterized protein BGW36DRAFT_306167 [Talaromyces proteolyticus]KAH8690725.1 hypothetical protein BGW36DRAFT_306167 [Talaromyces proteolyticus]
MKETLYKRDNRSSLTPNGKKAGSAGGNAVSLWEPHLGWWYDWNPAQSSSHNTEYVPMLWGDGDASELDSQRYQKFETLQTTSKYLLGFNEPDCSPPDSSSIAEDKGAQVWNDMIAPWGQKDALLGSPAMCKQADEDWLTLFESKISRDWDFTAIHVYKNSMDGVNKDLDHYWDTYEKPIWVTEFACVDDQNEFTPCTDQNEINSFINDIVDLFEGDDRVYAYAYTDGDGLGNVWPPTNNGQLTESGQSYLSAISKYS